MPFDNWNIETPTKSLDWYDAYNKTKHNRKENFVYSTFEAVLKSIAANLILFSVRFGPYSLFNGGSLLSSYVNQYLEIELYKPDITSFYIPKISISKNGKLQVEFEQP